MQGRKDNPMQDTPRIILARHKWVAGATITESCPLDNPDQRRFTATIRGFRNWKIWEGSAQLTANRERVDLVTQRVKEIRARIDAGDETIFDEKG